MKSCDNCRYMYDAGGECACYVCELFGDDVPYEFAEGDGCCLHSNEVKKAIALKDSAMVWYYAGYGREQTEQEMMMAKKTFKEYSKYMKHLRNKYTEGER